MTVIAIDGPSGSGKSTLARLLAANLGLDYLDTGAMYRAVALLAVRTETDRDDDALAGLARGMDLDVGARVVLDGEDVTVAIRTPQVTDIVSRVAATQAVRDELVRRQRTWVAARGGGVVEGRDIGTVVFPDADVKVFLTANPDERARRRAAEPVTAGGGGSVEENQMAMARRDAIDITRSVSPLVAAPDALVVDSTSSLPEEIAAIVLQRLGGAPPATSAISDSAPRPPQALSTQVPGKGALAFYAVCRAVVVGVTRAWFPGRVIGAERLPRTGAYVLAPIHRSYVDWVVVARLTRRRLRYLVKAEVWKVAAAGRLIELLGAFPVHRGTADRESLTRCLEVLRSGEPLVVFPEGTRQEGEAVQQLLEGAAYMALRADVPIFPVGLAGTERAMPRGARFPKRTRIAVVVGEALGGAHGPRAERVSRRATSERTAELREAIQRATDEARALLGGSGR